MNDNAEQTHFGIALDETTDLEGLIQQTAKAFTPYDQPFPSLSPQTEWLRPKAVNLFALPLGSLFRINTGMLYYYTLRIGERGNTHTVEIWLNGQGSYVGRPEHLVTVYNTEIQIIDNKVKIPYRKGIVEPGKAVLLPYFQYDSSSRLLKPTSSILMPCKDLLLAKRS